MFAHHSNLSLPSVAYHTNSERPQISPRKDPFLYDVCQRSIVSLEALAANMDLLSGQVNQQIDHMRPMTEATIARAMHLSTERRRLVAARQWSLLLEQDKLEAVHKQILGMKATVLIAITRLKIMGEKSQSGETVTSLEITELLNIMAEVMTR